MERGCFSLLIDAVKDQMTNQSLGVKNGLCKSEKGTKEEESATTFGREVLRDEEETSKGEEASTSFGQCKRMEHIYQFQQRLVLFIGLGMLLSLLASSVVKCNALEVSSDRRGITLNERNIISHYENRTTLSRKLLLSPDIGNGTNRIGQDCSKDDIVVFQGSTVPLPNGVPAYAVEIFNACASDCRIADIHVSCGWFSSVRLVNPRVFRRLCYDDCLVNDGQPLAPGQTLSFQYANSFSYPLSVSSVSCF